MKIKIFIHIFVLLFLGACVGNKGAAVNESSGSMSISSPSALDTNNNSITYTVNFKNAKEILLQATDVEVIHTGTATGTASVSGSGLDSRTVTVSGISGVGTIAIKINAGVATFAKSKKSAAIGPSAVYTAANLAPAISISAPSVARTKNGPVVYTVTYTGASAVYLDATYVTLTTDGNASGSVAVTGTGPIKTVTISAITGSGSLGIAIAADSAISLTGVLSAAAVSSSTIVDIAPPTFIVSSPSASVTKGGPVTYTLTYSSDSSSISTTVPNISLNATGSATGTVSTVSGSGLSRTVQITGISGNGTLGISVAAGTATDSVGNTALASSPSTTFTVDNTAPTVAISAPSTVATNTGPVTYTVTYGGASSISLTAANITLQKTGTANATVAVSGSGTTTRTVTLSSITGDGTIGISIASATATDAVGNSAAAPASSTSFTVDNTTTGIAFSAPSLLVTKNTSVTYTVTYTDAATISMINSDVIVVTTGTAAATAVVSGSGSVSRTVTLSGLSGNGTVAIKLKAGTAIDNSGNTAIATGMSGAFTIDNIEPIITTTAPNITLTRAGPVVYTVSYTGASAVTLANSDVVLTTTGTAAAGSVVVAGAGLTTRTITLSAITGDGTIGINLLAGTAVDDVGNTAVATPVSATFTVDNTKPTFTLSAPSKLATTSSTVVYVATYSGASAVTLANSDVTLTTTGTATGTVNVTGSGTLNRNISISGISGNGTLGITVAAATASDTALNTADAPAVPQTIYVTDDPLFAQSWHLYNTGQTAFSAGTGLAGFDLNLLTSWKAGFKGSGVKVMVSDSGFQATHEDYAANVIAGSIHHNYLAGSGPEWYDTAAEPYMYDPHGTEVAGIISAVTGNALGGSGVAPSSTIASANILAVTSPTTDMILSQADNTFDIINQSWGTSQCSISAPPTTYIAKLEADRKIYVKGAGNDFSVDLANCSRTSKLRHGNANFDSYNNNPYTILVGAVNAVGLRASYSSPGSSLWISGLGGETGDVAPAMITTDILGCTFGSAPLNNVNSFQTSNASNLFCNYTSSMNGTSAATPTVSGAIALLLSANGTLTARDVKHILATTATKINPTAAATGNIHVNSPSGHVWQQGWVTNQAGYHFNNNFGFGLINVDAAVTMATNAYVALGAEVQASTSSAVLSLTIPDGNATGVESSLAVATNLTIEGIQITPSITHTNIGQIGLELTSPQGTKSILMNINNSLDGLANLSTEVFLSNAFYGENSAGTWKLKVIDGDASSAASGTLTGWTINVIGH